MLNFVVTIKNSDGKLFAYTVQKPESTNLYGAFPSQPGTEISTITYFKTKKLADQTARTWNLNFMANGQLLELWN